MKEVIKIQGQAPLSGTVRISSAKNATVALIPAAILAKGPVTIFGVPKIADVDHLIDILKYLNVQTILSTNGHVIIDPTNLENKVVNTSSVYKLRASYYFMGALLGRFKKVSIVSPGGCNLGARPIDLHLKGFERLGAKVSYDQQTNLYHIEAEELIGDKIFLDFASVGATINIMMAAVYAKGRTSIENAAKEPEVIDLANLLNKMGAHIRGAGTNVITIDGVDELSGCYHEVIPDRIEAGTYLIAAAALGENVTIENVIPMHLEGLIQKLSDMGAKIEVYNDKLVVSKIKDIKPVKIETAPYPGFATDLQQPLTALLTQANGISSVKETIYTERFKHCHELNKMGANIELEEAKAIIKGPTNLKGTEVEATDLRCGACLIIAGLMAEGITTIDNVVHIDRGYDEVDLKFQKLGAKLWRETIE